MTRRTMLAALAAGLMTLAHGYIKSTKSVAMRDGVKLTTDFYLPLRLPTYPALLCRTPYDRSMPWIYAFYICDIEGYALVAQSLRGTGGSQGRPTFFLTDGWGTLRDGYDAVENIAGNWWSNKKVGMWGASAFGMTQYFAAGAVPPHLVTCVPMIAATSVYHEAAFPGGVFRKCLVENWLDQLGTPQLKDSAAAHPDYSTGYWGVADFPTRYADSRTPMFHIGGWYDIFTGYLDAFSNLQSRYHNQKLLIGPWGHGGMLGSRNQGDLVYPPNAAADTLALLGSMLDWFRYWLKGSNNGIMNKPRVQFYLMGDCSTQDTSRWNRWVLTDTWPLRNTSYVPYYVRSNGLLSTIPPGASEKADTFRYDPKNPCPTIGGREYMGLASGYGPKDQRPIESRPDVLVYTTPVLTAPVTVAGRLKMVIHGSSDRRDTDWMVRLCDVYPDGRSILVTDGALMARHRHGLDREDLLTPGVPDTFEVDLWSTALVFNAGHRIRVSITSSNYPRFERNPNTGGPFRRNDTLNTLVATNVVYHTSSMPTQLLLPVVNLDFGGIAEATSFGPLALDAARLHVISPARRPEIRLSLAQPELVRLSIRDVTGRVVEQVVNGFVPAGRTNYYPSPALAAGVYYVYLDAGEQPELRKMVITR
ncbi:MAG: CocE/NonD family hydrolase [candidate division WOR-3 bacterium]